MGNFIKSLLPEQHCTVQRTTEKSPKDCLFYNCANKTLTAILFYVVHIKIIALLVRLQKHSFAIKMEALKPKPSLEPFPEAKNPTSINRENNNFYTVQKTEKL